MPRTEYAQPSQEDIDALKRKIKIMANNLKGRLPVRDDVTEAEYHRPPTNAEIRFGHGATHYRTFDLADCCHKGTRILKRWFKAEDGLRYYR